MLFQKLLDGCESSLEKDWIKFIYDNNLPLPEEGQKYFETPIMTRADFFYEKKNTIIYIDGPAHDDPQQRQKDESMRDTLEDAGYIVIAFGYNKTKWDQIIESWPSVFGKQ